MRLALEMQNSYPSLPGFYRISQVARISAADPDTSFIHSHQKLSGYARLANPT
jgi:hypothetical protein